MLGFSIMINIIVNFGDNNKMGNNIQQFETKFSFENFPCLKCDMVAINNPMNRLVKHREKCGYMVNHHECRSQQYNEFEIYANNQSKQTQYRLYRDQLPKTSTPETHKICLKSRKSEKYKLQINYDYSQLISSYRNRLKLQHKNIIKIIGVYLPNISYHCGVKVSQPMLLTEHMETIDQLTPSQIKNGIYLLVLDWIRGIQYLCEQLKGLYEMGRGMIGFQRVQEGVVGKVWVNKFLYQNQGKLMQAQSVDKYQRIIMSFINQQIHSQTNIKMPFDQLNFHEAKETIHKNCKKLGFSLYKKQAIDIKPKVEENSKTIKHHLYTNRNVSSSIFETPQNFRSEKFPKTVRQQQTQKGHEKKLQIFSARKNEPTKMDKKSEQKIKRLGNQSQCKVKSIKNQHYSLKYFRQNIFHGQAQTQTQTQTQTPVQISHQPEKNSSQFISNKTSKRTIQTTEMKTEKFGSLNLDLPTQKKRESLLIISHQNPISHRKSAVKQSSLNHCQTSRKPYLQKHQQQRVPLYLRQTPTNQQKPENVPNNNSPTSPTKSQRKSIQKADLLRYQSYYNHIILQPFPKYDKHVQNQPLSIPICIQPKQIIQQKQSIDAVSVNSGSDGVRAPQNLTYFQWKNHHLQNQEKEEQKESLILNNGEDASVRNSMVDQFKQYSSVSSQVLDQLKQKQVIEVVESYITTHDQHNKSLSSNKKYVIQESLIIRGLDRQENKEQKRLANDRIGNTISLNKKLSIQSRQQSSKSEDMNTTKGLL